MHNTFTIFALGLLQMSNALTTITISVNTGDCSAPSPTDSYTDSEPASTDLGSATTTSSSDPTTTSSTTYPRSPCPDSPGSSYTDTAGEHYEVYCNTGIIGSDLPAVHATSFDHCLTLCDSYLPLDSTSPACEAVTFISTDVVTGNCQLKFDVKSVILLTYAADSAKLSRIPFSPEVSASISSVLATASETASPISTGEPVSTSVSDSSTSSPSPTSSPSSPNACPCPESDNQTVVDSQNLEYQVACHETFGVYQDSGAILAQSFDECMVACDFYVDNSMSCLGAAYLPNGTNNGNNCFLSTNSDLGMVGQDGSCVAIVPTKRK